jgi:hypothetical protein
MRVCLVAKSYATMYLDVFSGVIERSPARHQQGAFDLHGRIITLIIHRHRGECGLIARAIGSDCHVCAVMLDRLKAANRPTKWFAYARVSHAHFESGLRNSRKRCCIDQAQTQETRSIKSRRWLH